MSDEPWAYVWRCAAGHECTVSEAAMRDALVRPRCTVQVKVPGLAWRWPCYSALVNRLRPLARG